jgi:hypothetical protein
MTKFTAKLFTMAESAETVIEAATPAEAIAKAHALFDDQPEALDFDSYATLHSLDEIELRDPEGREIADWLSPNLRLELTAPRLLRAAKLVVTRWESGDLAEAVRELAAAIAEAEGRS